jgi:hypothetical protein
LLKLFVSEFPHKARRCIKEYMNIFFINNWKLDNLFFAKLVSLRFWFGVFKRDYLNDDSYVANTRVVIISFCGFGIGAYQKFYD